MRNKKKQKKFQKSGFLIESLLKGGCSFKNESRLSRFNTFEGDNQDRGDPNSPRVEARLPLILVKFLYLPLTLPFKKSLCKFLASFLFATRGPFRRENLRFFFIYLMREYCVMKYSMPSPKKLNSSKGIYSF